MSALTETQAWDILRTADTICSEAEVNDTLDRLAREISERLGATRPLVLSVMGGAVVFTGHLLPRLVFPLDFDYVHVSRYRGELQGGVLDWRVSPERNVVGRTVLVLDDILDEGKTLAAVRARVLGMGAKEVYCAVFADKETGREKPLRADFVGVSVPNRYVFGFGMDVHGAWRNLPAVYALRE